MATTTTTLETRPATPGARPALPSVLAVVVTHQGRAWLRDCLVALNRQSYPLLDVLVVDDASPDFRTPPHLKRVVKRHLRRRRWGFLRTPRPLGFGGAINWALSRVRTDADLLLFIHDDAALEPSAIEKMTARLVNDESAAIVGPKVVSWDDPERLEEVGMAVDRFGYPYKGLEEGEIDLGQHDNPNEVFYVTSTCMLVRHDVFRELRGWDSRMRAYSEDLDLCWRARLAGHAVRMEPAACTRHAIAMATGQRATRFVPMRYFSRRNRLRAVAKNASGTRLAGSLPQFLVLALAEMLGFIVLRQPREILYLFRAMGWNLLTLPETLSERARVQRVRKVTDRKLKRLTVRQSTRVHSYITHKAGRLEEAWGRRADFLAQQGSQARALTSRASGWPLAIAAVVVMALLVGFRHFLWAPPASTGELLAYPGSATGMWRTFLSAWQPAGLGYPGPAPPAFVFLGFFSLLTLGAAGAAQKLLLVTLAVAAGIGAYRLTSEVVDRPARIAAALAYVLGAVGYSGVRGGHLAALAFGAAAPFVVHSFLRLSGWIRPPGWNAGREVARATLGIAASVAFVPGSLALYALVALVLSVAKTAFGRPLAALRSAVAPAVALVAAWALLLPWSATWSAPGGPLERLRSDDTWRAFASSFRGEGMSSVLAGQTPEIPALTGVGMALLGVIAVLTAEGQRRRVALALWSVIVTTGVVLSATASGAIRPFVASPTEAGVLAAVAFAGLAGLAVGAFRLDLPRKGLGLVHPLTLGGVALAAFFIAAGTLPALWHGEWTPGGDGGAAENQVVAQIDSLLRAEAVQEGHFRTLWVGDGWSSGGPSAALPTNDHLVTGAQGQTLRDLFPRGVGPGEAGLHRAIASIEEGATDQGGQLLGAYNIRYVVLEPGPRSEAWLAQRDLAQLRTEDAYLLLENDVDVGRAGVYNHLPTFVEAIDEAEPELAAETSDVQRTTASQESAARYVASEVSGPGTVFLAETQHDGWRAHVGDAELRTTDGGWANAFTLPASLQGRLVVSFPHDLGAFVLLLAVALGWVVVVGAAFSRRRPADLRRRVASRSQR